MDKLFYIYEKLEKLAEMLNRGEFFNLLDAQNEIRYEITELYKSAAKNFDDEKKTDYLIDMWKRHG